MRVLVATASTFAWNSMWSQRCRSHSNTGRVLHVVLGFMKRGWTHHEWTAPAWKWLRTAKPQLQCLSFTLVLPQVLHPAVPAVHVRVYACSYGAWRVRTWWSDVNVQFVFFLFSGWPKGDLPPKLDLTQVACRALRLSLQVPGVSIFLGRWHAAAMCGGSAALWWC